MDEDQLHVYRQNLARALSSQQSMTGEESLYDLQVIVNQKTLAALDCRSVCEWKTQLTTHEQIEIVEFRSATGLILHIMEVEQAEGIQRHFYAGQTSILVNVENQKNGGSVTVHLK